MEARAARLERKPIGNGPSLPILDLTNSVKPDCEAGQMSTSTEACFLCDPNPSWVWLRSDNFFAMSALGPVVKGMSIIATVRHTPSMFDVDNGLLSELSSFTDQVCKRMSDRYPAPVHITEHGRVGLCEIDGNGADGHCYHAHRLLFPTEADLSGCLEESEIAPLAAQGFAEARKLGAHLVEYLYHESPGGDVRVGTNDESMPRQYFRGVVADAVGKPHLRSWRSYPRTSMVDAAASELAR